MRYFQPGLPQGADDIRTVPHRAVLDPLEQVVPDQVAGLSFKPETGAQPRRLDVGAVSGLLRPRPRRVVRPAPAVFGVDGVAQRAEGLLPAGRGDVEAAARLQVAPCGEDMHVNAAAVLAVQHGRPRVAVGLQPRPSRPLELIEDRPDLHVGGSVVGCPRDHARGVLVIELQRVGHRSHLVGISPEHLYAFVRLSGSVPLAEEVLSRRRRAGSTGEELNEHRSPGCQRASAPRAPVRW